jgi:hypothetical protein
VALLLQDEGTDADNRVVDVLRKSFADRLADFHVGLADKIVGGGEPAEVGHSLEVPDDDALFHAGRSVTQRRKQTNSQSSGRLLSGLLASPAWIYVSQVQLLLCVLELFLDVFLISLGLPVNFLADGWKRLT